MGTFKNAHRKREYRERVQPAARSKLGFLEKHTDYIKRAKDHHRKRDQLRVLKTRATQRNPDEFYFGMIRSRMVNGKHIKDFTEKDKKQPTADALALLKTQDLAYISTQRTRNAKQLQKLEEHLIETRIQSSREFASPKDHIYFASDEEEAQNLVEQLKENKVTSLDVQQDDLESDLDMLAELDDSMATDVVEEELKVRKERVKMLSRLEAKLRLDRHMLGRGRREKTATDSYGFPVYKWAPERKK